MICGLDELLAENPSEAKCRENAIFGEITKGFRGKIILFGAGTLGRKTSRALRHAGFIPLAFIDNNISLHGSEVDGVPVYAPAEAAFRWGNEALFIVTIFRSNDNGGMAGRLNFLQGLGCCNITTFIPLAWSVPGILPHFAIERPSRILSHAQELKSVSTLWADEQSRQIFVEQLRWRLTGDFSVLSPPVPDQYFPKDIVLQNSSEIFIDCGAFDGDTLRAFPWSFTRAWALEPDPKTAAVLRSSVPSNVRVCETAVGKKAGRVRFNAEGTIGSARDEQGTTHVSVCSLDDLLINESPTFIKLDVEGDELAGLEGAHSTLLRAQPVIAVCVYHKPEDLWEIPAHLTATLPSHRLYLRGHANDGFELVVYAMPHSRSVDSSRVGSLL